MVENNRIGLKEFPWEFCKLRFDKMSLFKATRSLV